jgi:hypothetical protein
MDRSNLATRPRHRGRLNRHVSPKHAQSYLASFAYRLNRRHRLDSIVQRLAWAAAHTSPQPYRIVTADV